MVWKIQLSNLLFKCTQLLFTLHSHQGQVKEHSGKQFSILARGIQRKKKKTKAFFDKNCTHKIKKKTFTAIKKEQSKKKKKIITEQNVDQTKALETEQLGLTLHKKGRGAEASRNTRSLQTLSPYVDLQPRQCWY